MISTKTNTKSPASDRKQIINKLKEKHNVLFKLEQLTVPPKFIPKLAYTPKNSNERVISLFASEIIGNEDIYTEFVSTTLEPEDPERRLWKWPYNAEFNTEYAKTEPHPATGHQMYLIPVDELIDVAELHWGHLKTKSNPKVTETVQLELPIETPIEVSNLIEDTITDAPLNQMTIRDKAAIDWKIPVSDKEWLNKLITKHF
jgi:hypothetical protein